MKGKGIILLFFVLSFSVVVVSGFWDWVSTTDPPHRTDLTPRQSFFRWQETQPEWRTWFFWSWDWAWLRYNRRLNVVAGISHAFICIGTATILNKRTLLTACNLLNLYTHKQMELRIWALGSRGEYNTPYRYRVWRFQRLITRSLNPEHMHGPRGEYSPRHDVCVIHTLDQMMTINYVPRRGHYPYRSFLIEKHVALTEDLWFTGSGYEYMQHIKENYKIFITKANIDDIVDCSKYLPKWWGKFICMVNSNNYPGLQNGGGLHNQRDKDWIAGIGCFEIRYNEDRIYVFTDLRYYFDLIHKVAEIYPGEYYEYAYPQWGMHYGILFNSVFANAPRVPQWQIRYDLYPLG